MKPEQFIREYGVGIAKSVLTGLPKRCTHMTDDARMFINEHNKELDENIRKQLPNLIRLEDLKRLFESLDLVKEYGGISMAKRQCACFTNACTRVGVKPSPRLSALQQAIRDYESIYGGGENA